MNQLSTQSHVNQRQLAQHQHNADVSKALDKTRKSGSDKVPHEKIIEPVTPFYVLGYN